MLKNSIFLLLFVLASGLNAQNFKFGKISKEEIEEKEHPIEKDADAAILYKYQRTYFDYTDAMGFKLVTDHHERVKIYNKDGFEWATKSIPLYVSGNDDEKIYGVKAYTYNIENGEVVETKLEKEDILSEKANKYRNYEKFTMPNVKEGSVIEYRYQVSSPFIFSVPEVYYQASIPVNKIETSFSAPEFLIFKSYINPKASTYVNVDEGTETYPEFDRQYFQTKFTIDEENIPSIKIEPHIDHLRNYVGMIKWELQMTKVPGRPMENYANTWEGVTKTIYEGGMEEEISKSNFYDEELDILLSQAQNVAQKIGIVYTYVQNKVLWNEFSGIYTDKGVKGAYKEEKGNTADINLLLVSMLQYAGLDASPVILSTPSNGIPLFPTRDGFNYVIAAVEYNDQTILMDASDKTAAVGELPKRARNWQGRLIREDGTSKWVNLYPSKLSEERRTVNLRFNEQTGFEGVQYHFFTGLYAKNFRNANLDKSNDDLMSGISGKNRGLNIQDYKLENIKQVGQDIKESYKFDTKYGYEKIAGNIYFKPLLFGGVEENPFKAEKRYHPVIFDFPTRESNSYNIMLPEGYEVVSIPESSIMQLNENDGEFTYTVQNRGSVIRINSEITFSKTVYTPNEYDNLKKFYDGIIKKQNESIVLRKIETDGLEERAEGGR